MSELARYTFLPWMRQGLASQLNKIDHLGENADQSNDSNTPKLNLILNVKGEKKGEGSRGESKHLSVSKEIQLFDPGDIIGIEKRIIVKTEPRNGVQQFEPNFLPYVDFYEEDFIWRYTPTAANNNRLRPWLALVVLKKDEFEKERIDPRVPLPSLKMKGKILEIPFPPAYQLWAWAHVQVNKELKDNHLERFQKIVHTSPNLACSRLICPRKLEHETEYFAFLIPAFEKGRLAGLGATEKIIDGTDIQLAAWGHEQKHFSGFTAYKNRFPIYHEWKFKTAKATEDFETLARKIVPRKIHPNVGKRLVDIQSPGYNLFYDGGEYPNQGTIMMEGVLRHPDSDLPDLLNNKTEDNNAFTKSVADLLNLEEDLKEAGSPINNNAFTTNPHFEDESESIYDDPIITPPIYGKWHAQQNRVDPKKNNQWVDQLNLDPRNRIAAGLGVETVRRNQEEYMNRAWGQYKELFEVNNYLKRTQLTIQINERIIKKHFEPLASAKLVSVTAPIHKIVRPQNGKSIKSKFKDYSIPNGVFSSGYNKVTRRGGKLVSRTKNYQPADRNNENINSTVFGIATRRIENTNINTAGPISMVSNSQLFNLLYFTISYLNKTSIPNWKWEVLTNNGLIGNYESGNVNLHKFRDALIKIVSYDNTSKINYFNKKHWKVSSSNNPADLDEIKDKLIHRINPKSAFHRKISTKYKNVVFKSVQSTEDNKIEAIINPPRFDDPTFEEILKISHDDFVPNLDLIPPNTSSLLEVNRRFLESYMVGLNYEMGRELLWREFPTDQRGTYFRMFWDSADYNARANANGELGRTDIQDIHHWKKESPLGSHQQEGNVAQPLILVIRGDLLNRYPFTTIYLQKAEVVDGKRTLVGIPEHPIFEAKVEPDIFLVGFNKEKEEVLPENGEGYFFVIQERPGELHFGLDSEAQDFDANLTEWDDINWGHLQTTNEHIDLDQNNSLPKLLPSNSNDDVKFYWGRGTEGDKDNPSLGEGSSADMAGILYQKPVKIAIHASAMLQKK